MFDNLSFKKKFLALLALFLVLGITAHKRSFSKTMAARHLLETTKEKLTMVKNSEQEIRGLVADVAYLDHIIGKEAANPDIVQQELLHTFSTLDSKAELVKLEAVHRSQNEYFNVYSNRLLLTGSFNDLLSATYQYEKDFDYSRVASLSFFMQKEPRSRRKKLVEQIIFQNYEKIH